MKIEEIKIEDIKPYQKNAKSHPKKQVEQIARSIKKFGMNQPIVIDKNNIIIVGHGRYEAIKQLKIKTVPCIIVDLTEEQAKTYRLADNKLNESDWDMNLVIEELKTLSLEMVDLSGFDSDLILETKEDESIDLSNISEPISKEGDIYELGVHRLICGDSEKAETYEKLMNGKKARMIFTDPPYSVDYVSPAGMSYNSEKYGGTGGRIFNDNKSPEQALVFYKNIAKNLYNFTTDDATLYWWFAMRLYSTNESALIDSGFHISQVAFWLKNQMVFSMGQLYHRIHEPCIIGWKKGNACYKNHNFTNLTELWNLDKKSFADHLDIWYQKKDNVNTYIHPCLPAGEKVFFDKKWIQIEEVEIGQKSEYGTVKDITTHDAEEIIELKINGFITRCTSNHPFLVMRDESVYWMESRNIKVSDFVLANTNVFDTLKPLWVEKDHQVNIHQEQDTQQKKDIIESTMLSKNDTDSNTTSNGNYDTEKSQQENKSTTEMEINRTIELKISSLSIPLLISGITQIAEIVMENGKNYVRYVENINQSTKNTGITHEAGSQEKSAENVQSQEVLKSVKFLLQKVGSVRTIQGKTKEIIKNKGYKQDFNPFLIEKKHGKTIKK